MNQAELNPILEAIRQKLEVLLALCPWMQGEAIVNLDPDEEAEEGVWMASVAFPLLDEDGEVAEVVAPVDWRMDDKCEGLSDELEAQIEAATEDLEETLLRLVPLYYKSVECVIKGGSSLEQLERDLDIGPA